ncbi:hypothetical protein B0I00_0740 [Novosphingobium kunmingense]|uniref:Uncharacterized protein n=1 Tax=Novosphingobium kunmingense TaxID=1211806 RepID=A0A2N0I2W0_9SPHN|nr:hypothetical protein [Novosphingobium kunmingense]PKB25538.1 hypothetical protein B0I00_0740 [Novosphingobium kunmingense]
MAIARAVLLVVGTLMVLMGLLWTGQGLGLIMWPGSSFMLGDPQWALYGSVTAAVGGLLVWLGARDGSGGE